MTVTAMPNATGQGNVFSQLWRFRGYILGSVQREFRLRYLGSLLGAALVFIGPAFQIAIYILVFGNLLKARLPGNPTFYGYSIYLCAGILFWNYFAELLQRTQGLYPEHANLIKKANFPRACLVAVATLAASTNLLLATGLFLVFLLLSSLLPVAALFWLPMVWLVLTLLALATGLSIAVLQVFFRDFSTLTQLALQALFWGTPIVYPASILPDWLAPWLLVNPLVAPVGAVQSVLLGTAFLPAQYWISPAVVFLLFGALAWRLHRQHQGDLLDSL